MTDQWSVLATLTPTEYSQFRDRLGKSSGLPVGAVPTLEFLLGNKNPAMVAVFAHDPGGRRQLERTCTAPACTTSSCSTWRRRGYPIPAELLEPRLLRSRTP